MGGWCEFLAEYIECDIFISIYLKDCGRAKRGDGTAKDGRKTERSSAPYAEAYSPRFCEYMFE